MIASNHLNIFNLEVVLSFCVNPLKANGDRPECREPGKCLLFNSKSLQKVEIKSDYVKCTRTGKVNLQLNHNTRKVEAVRDQC